MKRNTILLLASLVILAFYSCSKEELPDEPVTFPLTLRATKFEKKGGIKMFVAGKRVFDPLVIGKYALDYDYFRRKVEKLEGQLYFESADSIIFDDHDLKYSVKKEGDLFIFYSPPIRFQYPSRGVHYLDYPDIFKYGIPYQENPMHITLFDVRVGYGNYHHLELSLIVYNISYGDFYSSGHRMSFRPGEFNGNVSFLRENDTLAVQEYRLTFEK